jgi:anti-sigma B factor antagonist
MNVVIEHDGDVVVATPIEKHLDLSNSESFRDEIVAALSNCRKLVIDMGRVEFVDSRGCGAIISCLKHVSAAGGDLKLSDVKPAVRTVFELIRLHRICEILETRDQAIFRFESINESC